MAGRRREAVCYIVLGVVINLALASLSVRERALFLQSLHEGTAAPPVLLCGEGKSGSKSARDGADMGAERVGKTQGTQRDAERV